MRRLPYLSIHLTIPIIHIIKPLKTIKKFIFFAAAAIAVFSCSKNIPTPVNQAIEFEVVSQTAHTKANGTSLLNEGCSSFFCNAYFSPTSGTPNQVFMSNLEILPDANENPTKWAPATTYFWPRTGTINFFSYASARALGNKLAVSSYGTAFDITDYTVTSEDNILIADAVYHAGYSDYNRDDITDAENSNNPVGIPTLFRHLLSKISMDVKLATTKAHAGTSYEVIITSAALNNVVNKGSISLTNTYSGSSYGTQVWSPASDGTEVGWTPGNTDEDIALLTPTLTLAANSNEGSASPFLAARPVLPQEISTNDDMEITITFTVRYKHDSTTYAEEQVTVSSPMKDIPVTDWNINQFITYHVSIDPVTAAVTFDPAVSAWIPYSGSGNSVVL